jgi:hypothetical protein
MLERLPRSWQVRVCVGWLIFVSFAMIIVVVATLSA